MTAGETRLNVVVLGACWGISKPLISINISLLPHHPAVPTHHSFTAQNCVCVCGVGAGVTGVYRLHISSRADVNGTCKGPEKETGYFMVWLVAEASMTTCSCECVLGCPIIVDGWGDLHLALYDSCYLAQTCYSERCRSPALILMLL